LATYSSIQHPQASAPVFLESLDGRHKAIIGELKIKEAFVIGLRPQGCGPDRDAPTAADVIVPESLYARPITVNLIKPAGVSELGGQHLWSRLLNHI
jgi:hypothetical protein